MHPLELRIPPPAVALVIGGLMWLLSWTSPEFGFTLPGGDMIAIGLAAAGAAICAICIVSFVRARTTVNPMKPESSSTLIVSGIYRFTRNPMYLGLLLILIGWAVFISNLLAFAVLPAFVIYINRFQIEPEERALASRFRDDFVEYASRVRRWL